MFTIFVASVLVVALFLVLAVKYILGRNARRPTLPDVPPENVLHANQPSPKDTDQERIRRRAV